MLDTRKSQTGPDQAGRATDPALLARFAAIVGDKYAITDPQCRRPMLSRCATCFWAHAFGAAAGFGR